MVEKNFNFLLSLVACLAALEAGALVQCIGLGLDGWRQWSGLDTLRLWMLAQMVILPLWLVVMAPAALLRMVLGQIFHRPRPVALITGAAFGVGWSLYIAVADRMGWPEALPVFAFGILAGLAGGWVWLRVEKPWLARQRSAAEPSATPAP